MVGMSYKRKAGDWCAVYCDERLIMVGMSYKRKTGKKLKSLWPSWSMITSKQPA